jgi:hypothetical protein
LRMKKTSSDKQLATNWPNTQSRAANAQRSVRSIIHMFNHNIFCGDKC